MNVIKQWIDQISAKPENNQVVDWFYDRYQSQSVWLRRFQLAFLLQALLNLLLAVIVVILLPLTHYFPVLIKQNTQTGETFVSLPKKAMTVDRPQIESDLVDYVISRETYSYVDRHSRYQHVAARTGVDLLPDYRRSQIQNSQSNLVTRLGKAGLRRVTVEEVVLLSHADESDQKNLAKIDFMTITQSYGRQHKHYWVATLAWNYEGPPKDKRLLWENWNGFTVTFYRIDQRNTQNREENHD